MAATFDGKVALFGDQDLEDTRNVAGTSGLDATSGADFLLLRVPDPEGGVVVGGIMEVVVEEGGEAGALVDRQTDESMSS